MAICSICAAWPGHFMKLDINAFNRFYMSVDFQDIGSNQRMTMTIQQENHSMDIRKVILPSLLFFMAISLTGLSNSTRAQSYSQLELDPKRVMWTQLSFRVKNFSADVNVQVHLESLPAAEVETALIKSPQGVPINAWIPDPNSITVHYMVDSIFKAPVKTMNQVWFNPKNATALGRTRLRRGDADFKKIYRFTNQGVFRHQQEPQDRQEILEQPEKWTGVKDTFYTYDLDQLECPNVTERLVLIYIASASAAEISKSMQPLSFCVFGRRQLFHVRLKPEEFHTLKVDFMEKKQQGDIRRRGDIQALKIVLEVQPLVSELKKVEDFSFLGFQEDIAIFIDPQSTIPIQMSGRIPMVGKKIIKLSEVQLK